MPNTYCTLTDLRAALHEPVAQGESDRLMLAVIEDVSRQIDLETGHRFYAAQETRVYTAEEPHRVLVDDLLAVSAIRADRGANRTYSATMSTASYELGPANATMASPPHPYWAVEIRPSASEVFPTIERGVQIVGTWGFYNITKPVGTLTAALPDATTTSVGVSDPTRVHPGHTLRIGSEQLWVEAVAGSTVSVQRGVNGTTPASAASGTAVEVYEYPIVQRACMLQAARLLRRHEAPFGVIGSADVGLVRLTAGLDPDVRTLLDRLSRRVVG